MSGSLDLLLECYHIYLDRDHVHNLTVLQPCEPWCQPVFQSSQCVWLGLFANCEINIHKCEC